MASQQAPQVSLQAPDQSEPSLDNLGHSSSAPSADVGHETPEEYVDEVAEAWNATAGERESAAKAEEDNLAAQEVRQAEIRNRGTEAEPRDSKDGQSQSQAKEDAAPAPKPTDRVPAHQLARFHQQQKELFAQQQAFKADKLQTQKMEALIANAKNDPLAALEAMGYTNSREFLEQIAEHGGRETPERKEIRELKAWKAQQDAERTERETQAQQAQQQREVDAKLDQIRGQVQHTLSSDAYKDGLLSLSGTDRNVMTEMDRMATETGQMPRVEDAIASVERTYKSYLEEMAANPAVLEFLRGKISTIKSPAENPQSKQRARPQTIDSAARSPGTRVQNRDEYPSEEDTLAEAARFLTSLR